MQVAHHLLKNIVGQEAILDIRHFYIHGDSIVTGPLLIGGWRSVREVLTVPNPQC